MTPTGQRGAAPLAETGTARAQAGHDATVRARESEREKERACGQRIIPRALASHGHYPIAAVAAPSTDTMDLGDHLPGRALSMC